MALALAIVTMTALPAAAGTEGDVITNVLVHKIGEAEIKRYDIRSGDEILVHQKDVIEFPYASGNQILFLIDGDHLVIQFPGGLGFLTLLNFQKYLTDPDTAAHIEWGLGGKTVASVEDVFSQLSPAAGGTEGLAGIVPEAGEVTAGGSRDAANTFGDPQFGTPFPPNIFDPGPQARTAPPLPEEDEPIILIDDLPAPTAKSGSDDRGSGDGGSDAGGNGDGGGKGGGGGGGGGGDEGGPGPGVGHESGKSNSGRGNGPEPDAGHDDHDPGNSEGRNRGRD
jgi:uncharacterized membrane protein YgcG